MLRVRGTRNHGHGTGLKIARGAQQGGARPAVSNCRCTGPVGETAPYARHCTPIVDGSEA